MGSTLGYRIGVAAGVVAAFTTLLGSGVASCASFSGDDTKVDAVDASSPETSVSDSSVSSDAATERDADGAAAEAGFDGAARHLRVFVLTTPWSISTTYPAGGPQMFARRDSADHYCADEGMAAGLGAAFVAWMSVSGSDAIARLPADADWSLPNAAGAPDLIFPSRAAIDLAMNPMKPLNRSASGQPLGGTENRVWTGTDATGRASGTDCDNWGIFSSGTTGRTDSVGPAWTNAGPNDCGAAFHVFCFGY